MPKKITVKCHGPIALSKKHSSPREYVWLSWTDKPGRKKYYLAPCLVGKSALESDLKISHELKEKYKDDFYDDEISQYESALYWLSHGDILIDKLESYFTDIYTNKETIDRQEAEKMIAKLMKFYGYNNIVCKWKRPKIVVIPL